MAGKTENLQRRRLRVSASKWRTRGLSLLATLPAVAPADAADFTRYLSLTTDYVFRGVTYSDGHLAAQLGADLAFRRDVVRFVLRTAAGEYATAAQAGA